MKFICYGCEEWHNDPCILDVGEEQYVSGEHMRCPFNNAERDRHYCKWEKYDDGKVANLQPEVATLPKLTAEVFAHPDCPVWAKWAAVSKFGRLTFFEGKPVLGNNSFLPLGENHTTKLYRNEPGSWDASDWQNSLVERPAKLPDWCKVGEWCYCLDDDGKGKYFKITQLDGRFIYGDDWDIEHTFAKPARLRPYNAEEMRGLVGKVICKGPSVHFVTGFENVLDGESMVHVNGCLYNAEDLLRNGFTYDARPCGCLEHLENGEWVK